MLLAELSFRASNPATGEVLEPAFATASGEDVHEAATLAANAFSVYGSLSGADKGKFLRSIASGIEERGTEIVTRAGLETGLPEARLRGELARTTGQLRLFASVVEEGSWVGARIDPAEPERKPLPRADIRSMLKPLGPVVVFGASNFPLAFSVAGGDTASALAAGKSGHCEGPSGASGNQRVGWPGHSRERSSMRAARGSFFAPLRCTDRGRHSVGRASVDQSGWIHRLASRRQGADEIGRVATGSDSVLRRDGQRQSTVHSARRDAHTLRGNRDRAAELLHSGLGPVLHQAGFGLHSSKRRERFVYRVTKGRGHGNGASNHAGREHREKICCSCARAQRRDRR